MITTLPNASKKTIDWRSIATSAKATLGQAYWRSDLSKGVGGGLSIRARVRFAIAAAFLVTAPALMLGVMRTSAASESAENVLVYEGYSRQVTKARLAAEEAHVQAWHLTARPEVERLRDFQKQVGYVAAALTELVTTRPKEFAHVDLSRINEAAVLFDRSQEDLDIARFQADEGGRSETVAFLRLLLDDISVDMRDLDVRVKTVADARMLSAMSDLSTVGRDQLVLFLILLMTIPIFVVFVPSWVVRPMLRLRAIKHRIEEGHVRDLLVTGHDEVSGLARSLKSVLAWREDFEQKKSAKIFEVRNVLRGIVSNIKEAVIVIDKNDKISFANEPASKLLGVEQHYLEGSILTDHVFSPKLMSAIDNAQTGDVAADPEAMTLEIASGSEKKCLVKMASVHDREGTIARVVIVFEEHEL